MRTRHIPFILLAAITLVLMAATFVEKSKGNEVAVTAIYASWWMIVLWAVTALSALWVLFRSRMHRRPTALLLHLSLGLILAGALVTHLCGQQGRTHLRTDQPQATFTTDGDDNGQPIRMPFSLLLRDFTVENYPGTQSPMDYISVIEVKNGQQTLATLRVSMNHIGSYGGYRFYQSGYDNDLQGTILSVSHDPWGIGITYAGYALLFLAMLLLLVLPNEGFRRLLRLSSAPLAPSSSHDTRVSPKTLAFLFALLAGCNIAAAAPKTLPRQTAEEFGNLYTYYNGRICPLQTVAKDFTTKLYGKSTYEGLTAEQVLTGWMFYPTDWIEQPFIKVKGRARQLVGSKSRYASYNDFFGTGGYKLDAPMDAIMRGESHNGAQAIREADEKMNILRMLFNGQLLKLFPYREPGNPGISEESGKSESLTWFSQGDPLSATMSSEQWTFIKKSLDYAGELVWMKRWADLDTLVSKMRRYQEKEAAGLLPSPQLFRAERLYNRAEQTRPLAMLLLTAGIVAFFIYLIAWLRRRKPHRAINIVALTLLTLSTLYLLFLMVLRGYISHHLPLTNGYETMQAMSLLTLLLTFCLHHRYLLIMPFGLLLAGLTLLVAMMGEANPQITPLMPVLASPLLSIHVCIIMLAYSLLAFTLFNGLTALALILTRRHTDHLPLLTHHSSLLLYPAVFCLAAGIFIGAIWANQSWGRYWGWDPKEVWALITLIVYSFPLHRQSIAFLRRPLWFHLYMVLAFLAILMTYFGVNFFLGGMHSYA